MLEFFKRDKSSEDSQRIAEEADLFRRIDESLAVPEIPKPEVDPEEMTRPVIRPKGDFNKRIEERKIRTNANARLQVLLKQHPDVILTEKDKGEVLNLLIESEEIKIQLANNTELSKRQEEIEEQIRQFFGDDEKKEALSEDKTEINKNISDSIIATKPMEETVSEVPSPIKKPQPKGRDAPDQKDSPGITITNLLGVEKGEIYKLRKILLGADFNSKEVLIAIKEKIDTLLTEDLRGDDQTYLNNVLDEIEEEYSKIVQRKRVAQVEPTETESVKRGEREQEVKVSQPKVAETQIPKNEEVGGFFSENNIKDLLPEGFKDLNDAQKLLVTRSLQNRIIDLVKQDAKTQYGTEIAKKNFLGKIKANFSKEKNLKNTEGIVLSKILASDEGKALIRENLEQLTASAKERDIQIGSTGKPEIIFLRPDSYEGVRKDIAEAFNVAANKFREIPYEWGQGKGKNKKEYDKVKSEYEAARGRILKTPSKEKNETERTIQILQLDNSIRLDQLLNTHPEVEKEFNQLSKKAGWKETRDAGIRILTGGGAQYAGVTGLGYGIRAATASMHIAVGLSAPITGGLLGGARGWLRGKQTLVERKQEARHGKKDTTSEREAVVDAEHLSKKLQELAQKFEDTESTLISGENRKRKVTKADLLKTRIEHTVGKIERGEVNFGDANSSLKNQAELLLALNNAIALSEINKPENRASLEKTLTRISVDVQRTKESKQKSFLKKQMWKSAAIGASAGLLGAAIRYAGEEWGWWGGHGGVEEAAQAKARGAQKVIEQVHKNRPGTPPAEVSDATNVLPRGVVKTGTAEDLEKLIGVHDAPPSQVATPTPGQELGDQFDAEKIKGILETKTVDQITLDHDAIIGKGEGIEHALRRQIEHDPELAQRLGFKGDIHDARALHEFSGRAAHAQALEKGYVDSNGHEVRIRKAGEVAYQFQNDNFGKVKIVELEVKDGKLIEEHVDGTPFEKDLEKNEYPYTKHSAQQHANVEDAIRANQRAIAEVRAKLEEQMNQSNTSEISNPGLRDLIDKTKMEEGMKPEGIRGPENFEGQRGPGNNAVFRWGWGHGAGNPNMPYTTDYDRLINRDIRPGDETPYERLIDRYHPSSAPHYVPLPEGVLNHINEVYEQNLDILYVDQMTGENAEVARAAVKSLLADPAKDIIENMDKSGVAEDSFSKPLFEYLAKIKEVLPGLKPKGGKWYSLEETETTGQFIRRALATAARKGPETLNKLTLVK